MNFDEQPEVNYAYRGVVRTESIREVIEALETFDPATPVCWAKQNMLATRGVWVRLGTYGKKSGSFIDGQDLTLYVDSFYVHDDSGKGRHEGVELNHGTTETPAEAQTAQTVDELLEALVILDCPEEDADSEDTGEDASAGVSADMVVDVSASVSADAVVDVSAGVSASADAGMGAGASAGADGSASVDADASANDGEPANAADDTPDEVALPADPEEGDAQDDAAGYGQIKLANLENRILVQPDADPLRKHSLSIGWKLMHYRAADGSALIVFD